MAHLNGSMGHCSQVRASQQMRNNKKQWKLHLTWSFNCHKTRRFIQFSASGFFSPKFSQAAATAATAAVAALTLANLERLLMELKQNFTSVAPETFFSWKKLFLIFLHPSFFVFLISRVKKYFAEHENILSLARLLNEVFLWRREICPIEKSPNLKNTSLT